ncbi:hypothetical protein FRB98_001183 [Tulasnella sp. 332]|nr:hypothetical protein FRB98_001183 [Tulasnella sp. 332]
MGGKGKSAKARPHNKSRMKTKEHFAKGHLTSRHLYPILLYKRSAISASNRPKFQFGHVRRDRGCDALQLENVSFKHSDALSIGPKANPAKSLFKPTPSKAMRSLEAEEFISYNWMKQKVMETVNLSGLLTRKKSEKPVTPLSSFGLKEEPVLLKQTSPFPFGELPSPISSPASSYVPERPSRKPLPIIARGTPVIRQCKSVSGFKSHFTTPTRTLPLTSSAPKSLAQPSRTISSYNFSSSRSDVTTPDIDSFEPQAPSGLVGHQSSPPSSINLGDPWDVLVERMGIKSLSRGSNASILPIDFAGHPGLPPREHSGADFRWALCSSMFPASLSTDLIDAPERDPRAQLIANSVGNNMCWDGMSRSDHEARSKHQDVTFDNQDVDLTCGGCPSPNLPYSLTAPAPRTGENRGHSEETHNHSYLSESPSPSPAPPTLLGFPAKALPAHYVFMSPPQATTVSLHFIQQLVEGYDISNLSDGYGNYFFATQRADDTLPSTEADLMGTGVFSILEGLKDGRIAAVDGEAQSAFSNLCIDAGCSSITGRGWHEGTPEGITTTKENLTLELNNNHHLPREASAPTRATAPEPESIGHAGGEDHDITRDTPDIHCTGLNLSNADGCLLGPSLFDDSGLDEC